VLFADYPIVLRGGGDLASGAAYMLNRAGFPVVILELAEPLAIRRRVAFSSSVDEGTIMIDGVTGRLADTAAEALWAARQGTVAVLVSPDLPHSGLAASVVVDARLAKRNIDTTIDQAPLVIGLGPGFTAGADCDAVIETMRGHNLGRVIWEGTAAANTGVPGIIGGATADRVVRAPTSGPISWTVAIGESVTAGQPIGAVADTAVAATIGGVVRGLIRPGIIATPELKIADIDPRGDIAACFEISDKARLVGAGVLEAVLTWLNRR
jgi:xanthine dehydrogenase accessory factor